MKHLFTIVLILSANMAFASARKPKDLPLELIKLPKGFQIAVYARVEGARSLALGGNGTIYVGTRGDTKVYAVRDNNRDGTADEVRVIADDLDSPNGVAFAGDTLYVSERTRIIKFSGIGGGFGKIPKSEVVYSGFPEDKAHSWKYLAIGPDDKLYVPVGAPCNICNTDGDPGTRGIFSRIFRLPQSGGKLEEVAKGIRNTVGFDWHPRTKELWFTDNGRDYLGNETPPDELNRITRTGQHFGYPFFHGNGIKDPEFGDKAPKGFKYEPPVVALEAHAAALGMKFYTGNQFPKRYQGQIFIAEHGSWNRDPVIGFRVMLVRSENGRYLYEPFAEGWLQSDQSRWGRPVDVLVMPDGALLVSDDMAGAIYRITYGTKNSK